MIKDNDTRGVRVTPTEITVAEGEMATYTAVLTTEPTSMVTITIGGIGATDVSVDDTTMEFNVNNWDQAQKVIVKVAADDDAINDRVTLNHTASGGGYGGVTIADVVVKVTDEGWRKTAVSPRGWLPRFGRTVSIHVLEAIEVRTRHNQRRNQLTFGGHRVEPLFKGGKAERTARASPGRGRNIDSHSLATGLYAGGGLPGSGQVINKSNDRAGMGLLSSGTAYRRPGPFDLRNGLLSSSFFFANSQADGEADGNEPHWFDQLAAWGRAASTRFRGADDGLSLDGKVSTAMFGVDIEKGRWMTGMLFSHSEGKGAYKNRDTPGGELTGTLTNLNPFVLYELDHRTHVWGTYGYGLGDLTLTGEESETEIDTDLVTRMVALGGRAVVSTPRDGAKSGEVAIRSDGLWTNTKAERSRSLVGDAGSTSRVRVLLEVTGDLHLDPGVLTPVLENGLLYYGGDAETGMGLELGGGLAYTTDRLTVEGKTRRQVVHDDMEYQEQSFSGSIAYRSKRDHRGLRMNLGTHWGETGSVAQSVWSKSAAENLVRRSKPSSRKGFQGEVGYGFIGPKVRAMLIPFLGVESRYGERQTLKLGMKLTSRHILEAGLELNQLKSVRGEKDYRVKLGGRISW